MRRSQADAKRGEGWGHLFVASASCMAAEGRRRKEESPLQGFGGGGGGRVGILWYRDSYSVRL